MTRNFGIPLRIAGFVLWKIKASILSTSNVHHVSEINEAWIHKEKKITVKIDLIAFYWLKSGANSLQWVVGTRCLRSVKSSADHGFQQYELILSVVIASKQGTRTCCTITGYILNAALKIYRGRGTGYGRYFCWRLKRPNTFSPSKTGFREFFQSWH